MLHPFVSARALRFPRLSGFGLSLAAHGGLIAAAVASTAVGDAPVRVPREATMERIVFTVPTHLLAKAAPAVARSVRRRIERAAEATRDAARQTEPAAMSLPDESAPLPTFDGLDLEEVDVADAESVAFDAAAAGVASLVGRAFTTSEANGLYSATQVEKVVGARQGNPRPYYPASALRDGTEGDFTVRFVVDTLGLVDAATLAFPASAPDVLVRSVRSALVRSRFYPAELGGRRVRQLVEQRFTFVVKR